MINQNFVLDFMSKAPQATTGIASTGIEIKKIDNRDKVGFPNFKDVLNSTMDKTPMASETPRNFKQTSKVKDSQSKNEPQEKQQVKTFKEAQRNNKAEAKTEKVENKSEKVENNKDTKEVKDTKETAKAKGEAIIDALAYVLGIKSGDLQKVLDSMGLKPEDLTSEEKLSAVVDRLSGLAGLDATQKQTLAEVMKMISGKVNEASGQTKPVQENKVELNQNKAENALNTNTKDKSDWVKVNNVEVEVKNDPVADLKKILQDFKAKLDELKLNLQQNPQRASEEILKKIEEVIANVNSFDSKGLQEATTSEETVKGVQDITNDLNAVNGSESAKNGEITVDTSKEGSKGDKDSKQDATDNTVIVKSATTQTGDIKESDSNNTQFNNVLANQSQKNNTVNGADKVHKDIPVQKNEIINQVVEKAKVVVSGEKSEMLMDLKPDSLGKLALKVVTERGMVVAKFVAENEQVKAVLEANMQLLKDSLEKQGLQIQGFSVSVGQDSQNGFNRENQASESAGTGRNSLRIGGEKMINVADIPTRQQNNPYNWSDSSINLTA